MKRKATKKQQAGENLDAENQFSEVSFEAEKQSLNESLEQERQAELGAQNNSASSGSSVGKNSADSSEVSHESVSAAESTPKKSKLGRKKIWFCVIIACLVAILALTIVLVMLSSRSPSTGNAAQLSIRTSVLDKQSGEVENWIQTDFKFLNLNTSGERVNKPTTIEINPSNIVKIEFTVKNIGDEDIACTVNLSNLEKKNISVKFFVDDNPVEEATDSIKVGLAKLKTSVICIQLEIDPDVTEASFSSDIDVVLAAYLGENYA